MNKGAIVKSILYVLVALILISCKNEAPPHEKAAPQKAEQQFGDTVFDEVKKKLEKDPNDVDALYHLADLYERSGQYGEAIEEYNKVIKLKPKMGYVYVKLGTAYDRFDKPSDAVRTLERR